MELSITNGIVSSKIYDKWDAFNFEIVNFPFLDGDVPRSPSYGQYISQLIRVERVCFYVNDFNNRNLFLTAKLLKQVYRCHNIRKAFSKFYHRHSELFVKYNVGLKTLLQQGISEPILKPTASWSPYIFRLVQKVKHRVYTIHVLLSEAILCRDSASYFI